MGPKITQAQLKRYGSAYVIAVAVVVICANLGWIPGTRQAAQGLFTHPYRCTMGGIVVTLAVSLGAWSWALGTLRGKWVHGLAALIMGGFLTGVALEFTPYILYPDDKYSVAFMWMISGAPIGFIAWAVCAVGARAGGSGGVALA